LIACVSQLERHHQIRKPTQSKEKHMTTTLKFQTNLNCNACVAAVKPFLDNEPSITSWDVDIAASEKTLTVHGDNMSSEKVSNAVVKAGFKVLKELEPTSSQRPVESLTQQPTATTYYPLILILAFLIGIVTLLELNSGGIVWGRAMSNFMGGFFLVFSFFKLLDLRGFADSYQMYDVVAQRFRSYGYAYPFIELLLGAAYLTGFQPVLTNVVTLIVMSVSAIGVFKSLVAKRKIRCACLGTVFNLPMSTVTLVEDSLMAGMAALMLFIGSHNQVGVDHDPQQYSKKDRINMQTHALHHHGTQHNDKNAPRPTSLFVAGESINPAGQPSELQMMLKSGDGTEIKDFETIHDERVHLVIVRNGLDTFAHLHPQIRSDGHLVVQYTFPIGGTYRLYADFQPRRSKGSGLFEGGGGSVGDHGDAWPI
jgi:copper chaperone CopZ